MPVIDILRNPGLSERFTEYDVGRTRTLVRISNKFQSIMSHEITAIHDRYREYTSMGPIDDPPILLGFLIKAPIVYGRVEVAVHAVVPQHGGYNLQVETS